MDKNKKLSKSKSNSYCSVFGCSSWYKRNPELSFHLFPSAGRNKVYWITEFGNRELIDVREAWILILKMRKPVSKNMYVCSRHFKEQDYFDFHHRKRRRLKKNACPSENLPIGKSQLTNISNSQQDTSELSRSSKQKRN